MIQRIFPTILALVCSLTLMVHAGGQATRQATGQTPPTLRQQPPQDDSSQKADKDFTLNVDVQFVQVPVLVLDKDGKLINDLEQSHFQIFENNVKQDITFFKHEDTPISVGLVIDNSGSMRSRRERVNSAALYFVRESNPDDETFIVNFNDTAYLEQDFTSSIGDLVDALSDIDPRGETALNDAVYLSIDHVKEGKWEKKALLVVSDGEDNASDWGYNKVLEHVRAAKNVTIYAIGLLEDNDQRGGLFRQSPSKKAKEELAKLAEATGGQAYFPKSLDEVEELCKRIAHDLRNQYTLGYSPKNEKQDGTLRQIRVAVNPPSRNTNLKIHAKDGYYAPGGEPASSPVPDSKGVKK